MVPVIPTRLAVVNLVANSISEITFIPASTAFLIIGALSGMAIGALVHDNRMELAKEDAQVIREAKQLDARQKEIDDTRRAVDSDSSWGKLEVKPWQERYNIENSEMPYQGPSLP